MENEGNIILYDRSTGKEYEVPEHVASGDSPSGLASETSYTDSLTQDSKEVKPSGAENSGRQNMERSYEQGSDLELMAEAEAKLAEAKRQLTTTNRKLNTRGIAGLSQDIMKALGASDAKNRGVAKQLTQILTEAYHQSENRPLIEICQSENRPNVIKPASERAESE